MEQKLGSPHFEWGDVRKGHNKIQAQNLKSRSVGGTAQQVVLQKSLNIDHSAKVRPNHSKIFAY